ncbi:nodulin-26-like [Aristolochia californica]|uniref:nodulin-26-like n=1 Tax=Aristolochia californica TaxID=171875 RepID=UPI0035DF7547
MSAVPPPTPVGMSPKTQSPVGLSPEAQSPVGLSSKPPIRSFISTMEEGRLASQLPETNSLESPTMVQKVLAEVAGTFILIFAGCGSVLIDQVAKTRLTPVGIAIVWGLALVVAIYSVGHISGAHFNPAVTIALAASRRFPFKHVPAYVAAQVFGSILASFILKGLIGSKIHAAMTLPSPGTSNLAVIVWEFITSFMLMFVVCGVATDDRAVNALAGVAVGATVSFEVLIAGQVTGASMNPARSIGPALAAARFDSLWLYIVAPTLGTLAAAVFYGLLRLRKSSDQMLKAI